MKIINSSLQCRYLHISLSLVFHRQTSDCDYDFAKKRHTKTHTHTKFTKQTDKVYGWIGLHYHIIMIIIYDRPSSELAVLNGCVCATISNWCKIRECFISFLCIVRSYITRLQVPSHHFIYMLHHYLLLCVLCLANCFFSLSLSFAHCIFMLVYYWAWLYIVPTFIAVKYQINQTPEMGVKIAGIIIGIWANEKSSIKWI